MSYHDELNDLITAKLTEENKKALRDWVALLRSGMFEQTKRALKRGDGYCCLGVACEAYQSSTGRGEWCLISPNEKDPQTKLAQFEVEQTPEERKKLQIIPTSNYYRDSMVLPGIVAEWLFGTGSETNPSGLFEAEDGQAPMGLANGNDAIGKTFDEIADAIERTYLA